jgi:hypothetical protein
MKIHTKSPCCGASSRKFGDRRRQCGRCGTTWSVRVRKRGRKPIRASCQTSTTLLATGATVKQCSRAQGMTERVYQLRARRSLEMLDMRSLYAAVPRKGNLILLIDGLWTHTDKRRVVVYLSGLKSVSGSRAYLLPPEVLPGAETRPKWKGVIESIPEPIKRRIVALVCDGLTGMTAYGYSQGWVVQRCQFHFIKTLERFKGTKNRFVKEKDLRQEIYTLIRRALVAPEREVTQLYVRIERLAALERCPKWVRFYVADFLRSRNEFRACILYPQFDIPATTSAMESACGIVRDRLYRSRGLRTLTSLKIWVNGLLYVKKSVTCNGRHQQNLRR